MKFLLGFLLLFFSYYPDATAKIPFLPDSSLMPKPVAMPAFNDTAYKHTYINTLINGARHTNTTNMQPGVQRGDGKLKAPLVKAPLYFAYLFILAFFILAIVKIADTNYFYKLFSSAVNTGQVFDMFQEGRFGFNLMSLNLDFFFILSLSVLIQQLFFPLHPESFGWIVVFTAGGYFLKIILIQLCAYLFFDQLDALLHVLMNLLFTRIIGLAFLPLVFFCIYQIHYSPVLLLKILFVILLIAYGLWMIRLLVKMKLEGISGIFYLILYLCALEVFPVLILLKNFLA
jgi:hypothetical protein